MDAPPGGLGDLQLVVSDIHAARAHLAKHRVEVSEVRVFDASSIRPSREGEDLDNIGFVFFSDPDGNGWAVQQMRTRD